MNSNSREIKSVWGKGKKGSVNITIDQVCSGSQRLFNANILSVHLKNLIMRMECFLLEHLQPSAPCAHLPGCCSGGSQPRAGAHAGTATCTPWTPPVVCQPWGLLLRHSHCQFRESISLGTLCQARELLSGKRGLWECGISGSWSAVAPSLHHPPSFLPPCRSVLGLVAVVAPALVLAVLLAPVTVQAGTASPAVAPGAAHPAPKLEVLGSSCSATVLLLQVNSH